MKIKERKCETKRILRINKGPLTLVLKLCLTSQNIVLHNSMNIKYNIKFYKSTFNCVY